MYETNNFHSITPWLKRIAFSLLASLLILWVILVLEFNFMACCLISLGTFFFLTMSNQIDELTITDTQITLETKSIIPFLRSKEMLLLNAIADIRFVSNQTTNDKGWFLIDKGSREILEIITTQGKTVMINGNLHPKGSTGIKNLLEKL